MAPTSTFNSRFILVVLTLMTLVSSGSCRQFAGLEYQSLHKRTSRSALLQNVRGGGGGGGGATSTIGTSTSSRGAGNPLPLPMTNNSLISKLTDLFFDKLDEDKDGALSFDEFYEIMLLISVKVNRQAPVPPPTKAIARVLFEKADADNSGKLTKDEIKTVAVLAMPRTAIRVGSHKIISFLGAPMLAMKTVESLKGNDWVLDLGKKWVPEKFHDMVLTEDFWKLALTVSFVSVLGNLVIRTSTWIYDFIFHLRPKKITQALPK